jgi:hypothetical protein
MEDLFVLVKVLICIINLIIHMIVTCFLILLAIVCIVCIHVALLVEIAL